MADTKISALTELAGTAGVAGDWLAIVDTSAGTTKKLDAAEVADLPNMVNAGSFPTAIIVACSDESTAIDATGEKVEFEIPYAMTVTDVIASLTSACTTGTFTVDINEAGTTILSTKLTIDATELTSTTAATAAVISDSALAANAKIQIDVDNVGDSTATGLKVAIIGTRDES